MAPHGGNVEGGVRRRARGDCEGSARPIAARLWQNQVAGGARAISIEIRGGKLLTSGPKRHSLGRPGSIGFGFKRKGIQTQFKSFQTLTDSKRTFLSSKNLK
jgi:hypothetical protein